MAIAIDTNVLVRLLIGDDARQLAAAQSLLAQADRAGEPVCLLTGVLLETEWVLRSRYQLDRQAIAGAFIGLLESQNVQFENAAALEEALLAWDQHPRTDFADCLHWACATRLDMQLGTFDARAAKLPGAQWLKAS